MRLRGLQWDRNQHGSLFDRGSADSFYNRLPRAHYGGVGGAMGGRVTVTDAESVAEYMAGYRDNQRSGHKEHRD